MTKRVINIGLFSSLILIFVQLISGLLKLSHFDNKPIALIMNGINMACQISIFIVLWIVLVNYFNQSQFDWLIKSMITLLITIEVLSIIADFQLIKMILIIILGLRIIELILYFVFLNRIMDIEKFEIKQIKPLKNYALTFIICVFGQLVLSILIEFKNDDLKFINHFLIMIPIIFILIFFNRIKKEELNIART
jgi:hypothetical protein